ncbi:MAG: type II secretion system protein [Candidatus Riflebacteria bacterium]|nr:type II secretion system protein [Candidatus Riflebacteria bacterium]
METFNRHPQRRTRRGFTLVEVLCAIVLVGLLVPASLELLRRGQTRERIAQQWAGASQVMALVAETLQGDKWAGSRADSTFEVTVNNTVYHVTIEQSLPDATFPDLKKIIVRLEWNTSWGVDSAIAVDSQSRTFLVLDSSA